MYTDEQYEELNKLLIRAHTVCAPDEYQKRQNDLVKILAAFILIPYHAKLHGEKSEK